MYIETGNDFDFETDEPCFPTGSPYRLTVEGKEKLKQFNNLLNKKAKESISDEDLGLSIFFYGYWIDDDKKLCIELGANGGIKTSTTQTFGYHLDLDNIDDDEIFSHFFRVVENVKKDSHSKEKFYQNKVKDFLDKHSYNGVFVDIVQKNGNIISENLFLLEDENLFCKRWLAPTLPNGACTFSSFYHLIVNYYQEHEINTDIKPSIYLNLESINKKITENHSSDYCGPEGGDIGVDLYSGDKIIGKEILDFWSTHHVEIYPEEYKIVNIKKSDPIILSEHIYYNKEWFLLSIAVGITKENALERLKIASNKRIKNSAPVFYKRSWM